MLISIAIKFFSIGYDNYNQVMKISGLNDTTQKLKNNENIENINDTQNIIVYSDDIEVFKKNKKKYSFWDLINK